MGRRKKILEPPFDEFSHMEITKGSSQLNFKNVPVTVFNMDHFGAYNFNTIYKWCLQSKLNDTIMTKSGGISIDGWHLFNNLTSWHCITSRACIDLLIIKDLKAWRFQFRSTGIRDEQDAEEKSVKGAQAFKILVAFLKNYGIDMNQYKIDNGFEVKKEIEPYMVCLCNPDYAHKTITNVHHIDFHSSFPAGLANTHPEFREPIEVMYLKRKERPVFKSVLNLSIGYMQSKAPQVGARWAHLSRDAINDNNRRLRDICERLRKNGCLPIALNTDGVWYKGPIYHGEGEGFRLGEWHNDHTNCQIRFKSAGAYEFIEDGKYTVVLRGYTKLDIRKPREVWQWGDIYNTDSEVLKYTFEPGKGILEDGELVWQEE